MHKEAVICAPIVIVDGTRSAAAILSALTTESNSDEKAFFFLVWYDKVNAVERYTMADIQCEIAH